MTARLPFDDFVSALTVADPHADEHARLEALQGLMAGALSRPVPSQRWRALRSQIEAELRRRSVFERRSASAILHDEIAAAIMLASESARLVAMRAYVEVFSRELRLRTADELLNSLCGHTRADGPQFEPLDTDIPAPDDSEFVELMHLWARLPMLADLSAAEVASLEREVLGEPQTSASRQALCRARRKIRALENNC